MPKKVDHDERRAVIAAAAAEAIDALGLDRVRLVDVARRASCTTGAVSHYFPGKEAVLAAALEHVLGNLVGHARAARGGPETASRPALADLLAEILPLDEARRSDWRVWVAFCGRAVHEPTLAALHRDAYAEIQRALARELTDADVADSAADASALAVAVVAMIDGLGLRATLEPDEWPEARLRSMLAYQLTPLLDARERPVVPSHEPRAQEKSA